MEYPGVFGPRIRRHAQNNVIDVNKGLHFTGGEPFLNYPLLLESVEMAAELDIPATFVETNCFWCVNDDVTERRMWKLKAAGLHGMLISSNPFVTECVPFKRIKRPIRIAEKVFEGNVIIYHPYLHAQLNAMRKEGKRGGRRLGLESFTGDILLRHSSERCASRSSRGLGTST